MFEEPEGWQNKSVADSPLLTDFTTIWKQLTGKYQTELAAFAYRPIPDEKDISAVFMDLINRIK